MEKIFSFETNLKKILQKKSLIPSPFKILENFFKKKKTFSPPPTI